MFADAAEMAQKREWLVNLRERPTPEEALPAAEKEVVLPRRVCLVRRAAELMPNGVKIPPLNDPATALAIVNNLIEREN